MQCDMCGRDSRLVKAKIEGTILDVCPKCAEFGEVIKTVRPVFLQKKKPILRKQLKEKVEMVVPNYYSIMKKAREKRGLKQEEVAQKLSERESLYVKIEKGQIKPSLQLAKKLENFFHIKLIEQYEEKMHANVGSGQIKKDGFTIADFIKTKK
ncbi:multiprotein bridging factor aMBF1 [Thermoproteota archaeon]